MNTHPDWKSEWDTEPKTIRQWAEETAKYQYDKTYKIKSNHRPEAKNPRGTNESTIKRYEFLLRSYLEYIRNHGVAGATESVVKQYEALGITDSMVYAATEYWRRTHQLPVRIKTKGEGNLIKRVQSLEAVLTILCNELGREELLLMFDDTKENDSSTS